MSDLPDLRAGVYRHWKGPLYNVLGYSHNASDENRPQVLYSGLELDQAHTGPRFATRDVDDFNAYVCTMHGVEWHSDEHAEMVAEDPRRCPDDAMVARFAYLGPVYYRGMETR